jgi:hypothetical protein
MDPKRSKGMNATLVSVKREARPSTITSPLSNRQDINDNKVVVASMRLPTDRFVPPVLMEGTVLPTPVVSEGDLPPPPKLFHQDDHGGRQPRGPPTIDYGRGAAGHPLASGRGGAAGYQNQDARSLLQASLGRGVPLGGGMMNFQQRAPPPPPPMMMGGPPQGYPQGYPQARGAPPGPPGGVPVGYPAGIPPPGGRPPSNYAPGGNRFAALNNLPRRAPPGPPGGRPPSGSNPPNRR